MKNKKVVILILIVMLLSYLLVGLAPLKNNEVYAGDMGMGTLSPDIDLIDDALYPGYKSLIKNLQAVKPNYRFLVYYTGMDWTEVLNTEYQGHGHSPRNLFQVNSNYNGMWQCPICGDRKFDNGTWCCASLEALAYMMDPRNSINENDVFQFKDLEGSDVSYADIARVVSGYGSYINNSEAIQAIVDASIQYNINGYFLVSTIINEHGKNGSTLTAGNGYGGNNVGCYNYFNVGSYGNGTANIINSGLSYANSQGWHSIRASILGGAAVCKESYITKYSQNTLYYQKFNVSGKSALASHQYQQNILAAQSKGTSLKSYYGSSNTAQTYTFIIPLYKNMPTSASVRPNSSVRNSITYEDGIVQNITTSLKVRASANGTAIGALNNGESIKILKRALTQVGGYYWDLIVSNKDGTYGYAARVVGGEHCIASTGTSGTTSGTASEVPPEEQPPKPAEIDLEKAIIPKDNYIVTLPSITCTQLKTRYGDAIIKDRNGNDPTSEDLGTGFIVYLDNRTFKIVKKGDVNGDGKLTIIDAVSMLNAVKGTIVLENEFKEAACVKNNETFNVTDVVQMLNCIKQLEN